MSVKKNGKKKISALFARSKVLGFFMGIASFLYDKAGSSIAGKIFSGYDKVSSENGMVNKLSDKAGLGSKFFRPVKRTVSRLVSQSVILKAVNAFLHGFLNTGMNIYGLFFMSSGVGFLVLSLLKVYVLKNGALTYTDTFLAALLIIISIPLLFSKVAFVTAVCRSKIAGVVIFEWLGGKKEIFEKEGDVKGDGRLALLSGILLCVLSWWIRPLVLMLVIALTVIAITVLYNPESGIVLLLFFLPFLPTEMLNAAVCYIGICFLLKYIRGKRTLKFDALAVAVLGFALLCMISNTSAVPDSVSLPILKNWLCSLCAFFLVINLIKSKKWIDRCMKSVCASGFFAVAYGIVRYVISRVGSQYAMEFLSADKNEYMVSCFGTPSNMARYLVIVLPFLIAGSNYSFKATKAISFFAAVLGAACLFLTYNYISWVAFVVGMIVFMVVYGKKTLAALLGGLCVLPLVYFNLPQNVLNEISLLNRISGYVADRVGGAISGGSAGVISFFCGSGIGTFDYLYQATEKTNGIGYRISAEIGIIGLIMFWICVFLCFQKNTTLYSRGCSKHGKLVSIAALSGIAAILSIGFDSNVLADQTINMMFWICMGLASCVSGTEKRTESLDDGYDVY